MFRKGSIVTSHKQKFRLMKNGYDRFAVDDRVDYLEKQVADLKRKLELYSQKLEQSTLLLDELRTRYVNLNNDYENNRKSADIISRAAIQEANSIIKTAQENADIIIKEALSISRLILTDLSRLSTSAEGMKTDLHEKLDIMYKNIEDFKLPDLPDLRWLDEAEKRMH